MRTSTTVGFAIENSDRPRLEHLTEVFGGGNRSAFLRRAMDIMDRHEAALRLAQVQAYGDSKLAEADKTVADIPEIVARALANPDPDAVAQAKLIVADIQRDRRALQRTGELNETAARFAGLLVDG